MITAPGWPVVLTDGPVTVRPYHRSDGRVWSEVRRANEQWLSKWEPTPPGSWYELNAPGAFRYVLRELRRAGRTGEAMPFAVCYEGELVGQLSIGNIVRRAFCSGYAGYWIDARLAGRGIIPTALALVVDHAFRAGGLHRIEVNIRPENVPSRLPGGGVPPPLPAHRRRVAGPRRVRDDRRGRRRRRWTGGPVAPGQWAYLSVYQRCGVPVCS